MIVSSPDGVPFAVGKLAFNHIRTKSMLIQNRAGGAAKSVPGGARMIAHAIQGIEHRVLAHKRSGIVLVWENILPIAGVLFQFPKNGNGLPRQRHDMQFLHLHAFGRNSPLGFVPINLRPLCASQFVRADEGKQQEAKRQLGLQAAVIGFQLFEVCGQVTCLVGRNDV